MAKYTTSLISDKLVWESFVLSQNPKSFLHSWNWGETNRLINHEVFRMGFYDGQKLVGVCLAIKEKAKRGIYFIVPAGPLIDWSDSPLVKFVIDSLIDLGKQEGAWFIRIRPELIDCKENFAIFKRFKFVPAPMHLHAENTWVLDITKTPEEILSKMRKNTRYSVKLSQKHDLKIEKHSDSKHVEILTMLQQETVLRHKFVGFSEKLFKAQMDTFGHDDQALFFVCLKNGIPLAAAIIIFYGDYAYYHHSGSTSSMREIPFSYFLQWEIINEAKRRGVKYYNFWGIAPTDNPKHRFWGVTVFKKGFGGERVDWLHAEDLPLSKSYWLTYLFEKGRKIVRRL